MAITKKVPSSAKFLELYIRELVKNTVKEEINKMLPVITESIMAQFTGGTSINETTMITPSGKKAAPDRATIRNIMKSHFSMDGDTIAPRNVSVGPTFDENITKGVIPEPKLASFLDNLLAGEYNPKMK